MKLFALLPFLVAASAPSFVTPDQFDLLCTGIVKRTEQGDTKSETWNMRYRIDLKRKTYCQNKCGSLNNIYEISEGQIFLTLFSASYGKVVLFVNRLNGELHGMTEIASSPIKARTFETVQARCKAAAFSGIPRKF
jgi:hypothetical protein